MMWHRQRWSLVPDLFLLDSLNWALWPVCQPSSGRDREDFEQT